MTPQQADKLLQEIGLFETMSVPEHYEKGVQLIGKNNTAPCTLHHRSIFPNRLTPAYKWTNTNL